MIDKESHLFDLSFNSYQTIDIVELMIPGDHQWRINLVPLLLGWVHEVLSGPR